MDCAGVHVLVSAAVFCARNECELQVTGGPAVQRLVELSGLGDEPWFHGEGEAVGR
jgi:anti-anti-sigma regulatory factor